MAKLDLIISDLRRRIREAGFRPGDMIPTQKELARELGVSVVTMGHAMRFLQEEGIIDSIRGKGTIIKALPDAGKALPLGIILANPTTPDDPVLQGPINSFRQACEKAGRAFTTFMISSLSRTQLREWAREISGCVVFGTTKPEWVNLIGSLGKPVVFHGEFYRKGCPPWASQITVSVELIASLSLQFLHNLGHRKLLLVRSRGTSYLESLGLHFQQQAQEHGVELEQLIVPLGTDGSEVLESYKTSPSRPSAAIVEGGMRAGRILHHLTRHGIRVPEELSLLAINSVAPEHLVTPHLSRVETSPRGLGERILNMIDAIIERDIAIREELLSSLVWGKTCRALPEAESPEACVAGVAQSQQ